MDLVAALRSKLGTHDSNNHWTPYDQGHKVALRLTISHDSSGSFMQPEHIGVVEGDVHGRRLLDPIQAKDRPCSRGNVCRRRPTWVAEDRVEM